MLWSVCSDDEDSEDSCREGAPGNDYPEDEDDEEEAGDESARQTAPSQAPPGARATAPAAAAVHAESDRDGALAGDGEEESDGAAVSTAAAVPEDADVGETGRLFVRNLPYTATDEELQAHFARWGATAEVRVVRDARGRATGCA